MKIKEFIQYLRDTPKQKIIKVTPKRDWNKPYHEQPKPFYMLAERNERSYNDYHDTVFCLFGDWYYIEPLLGFYKNSSNWRNPVYKNEHEFTEAWLTQMRKKYSTDRYYEIQQSPDYGLLDIENPNDEVSVFKLDDGRLTINIDKCITTLKPVDVTIE